MIGHIKNLRRRPVRVGAPPGVFVVDTTLPGPEIDVITFGPDTIEERRGVDPAGAGALRGSHRVLWVDVVGLGDPTVLQQLATEFSLHKLAMEDAVNIPQRPKVEAYPDHLFVVLQMPVPQRDLHLEQISLFVTRDSLVMVQEQPGDCLDPVRKRLREGRPNLRGSGADYLMYAIMDAVMDAFFPLVENFGERMEHLENRILAGADDAIIATLHEIKAELYTVRRSIWSTRDALSILLRDELPQVNQETRIYLRDVQDHALQLLELIDAYRDAASGLRDLHMTLVSNRMNEVMKVLTIIATVFIPLTFIAGIYGMNFSWMPELQWKWGYPVALTVMAAITVALLWYFRKKGWVRGKDSTS